MPWHRAPGKNTHNSLVQPVWENFQRFDQKGGNVPTRRKKLASIGATIPTAHIAAEWTRRESDAIKDIFERFHPEYVESVRKYAIETTSLADVLTLCAVDIYDPRIKALMKSYMDARPYIDFPALRQLVVKMRYLEGEPAATGAAAVAATKSPRSSAKGRPVLPVGALSGDDGGAPDADGIDDDGRPKTAESSHGGPSTGADGMALNDSAVELEINHVRRMLLARAFRQRATTAAVVNEHQVYREGLQRALHGNEASWQLQLQSNRDVAKARSVARSHWRPGTAGPSRERQQINVNPYAGPEGNDPKLMMKPPTREYTQIPRTKLEELVASNDRLMRKCGPG